MVLARVVVVIALVACGRIAAADDAAPATPDSATPESATPEAAAPEVVTPEGVPVSPPIATSCNSAEVTELRAHLVSQRSKADTWNLAWRITFTGAAISTAVVGYWNPFPSLQNGLYASAGKATIGALARWILPLRIHVPADTGDACTDVAALRKEIRRVARKQRSLFWMSHIGGALVNLGGAAYVYYKDGIGKAALSVAIGYPVGVLSNYTMPRGAWKLYRERETSWTVSVTPLPKSAEVTRRTESGWVLTVGGTF